MAAPYRERFSVAEFRGQSVAPEFFAHGSVACEGYANECFGRPPMSSAPRKLAGAHRGPRGADPP